MLGNITKKEKTLGIIVVCVALTALVYNFLVEPLIQRWNDLAEEIRSKGMLLAKHNRILREKAETERLHSEYTMYFQKEGLTHE